MSSGTKQIKSDAGRKPVFLPEAGATDPAAHSAAVSFYVL
jgi:hypothetical protein